ncbi:MAG: acyl-CoA dehydratase activase-related protein [Thermincola sp.]|nr:acyl-CoA dehydratase activase-related protein [Thermincola sp.]MDT3703706.1 acyl-CoA dehydratase activase-related protein [Thermincola sp.]
MRAKIGIPRALLYYYYYPLWKGFFQALGQEVVVSSKTTKAIMDKGVKQSVDDACLPVKLFFGHVLDLKDKADYIFVPRMVSVEKKAYICPKFLGLPDMIRYNIPDSPQIIDVAVNMSRKEKNLYKSFAEVGKLFTNNPLAVRRAFRHGIDELEKFIRLNRLGFLPHEAIENMEKGLVTQNFGPPQSDGLTIALIGHGYNIYDTYISMDVIAKLREMGVRVVTPDNLKESLVDEMAGQLPKRMFWTLGKKMIGSAFHFMGSESIDGIIHVASFGCGPDSFTGEIIERHLRRQGNLPFLNLTVDEHTGEAGVITRLEAFIDMIRWRSAAQ